MLAAAVPLLIALSPPRAFVTAGGGAELGTFAAPELDLGVGGAVTAGATWLPRVWVEGSLLPVRLLSADDPAPAVAVLGRVSVGGAWAIPLPRPFQPAKTIEIGPMFELSKVYGWTSDDLRTSTPVAELGLLLGSGEHGSGVGRWQLGLSEEIGCNERECVGAPAARLTLRRSSGLLIDLKAGVLQAGVVVGYEWGWKMPYRDAPPAGAPPSPSDTMETP